MNLNHKRELAAIVVVIDAAAGGTVQPFEPVVLLSPLLQRSFRKWLTKNSISTCSIQFH